MSRFKKRINWKGIIAIVLTVAAVLGACAIFAAVKKNDTKTISSFAFSVGGLDENGEHKDTDKSIYTKEAFDCIGLRIEPDFEFAGTFDVYYYDYNGNLVETKVGLKGIYDEDYPLAKMARIVITPEVPEDVDEDDFKISWYEVGKYANQLKITVDKKQEYLYDGLENLYIEDSVVENMTIANPENGVKDTVNMYEYEGAKSTHQIMVGDDVKEYHIFVRCAYPPTAYINAAVAKADGTCVDEEYLNYYDWFAGNEDKYEWVKLVVYVPEGEDADHLRVSMPSNAECYIFGVE